MLLAQLESLWEELPQDVYRFLDYSMLSYERHSNSSRLYIM